MLPPPHEMSAFGKTYLALLREQWFILFDRLALLYHKTLCKQLDADCILDEDYIGCYNKILVQQWPPSVVITKHDQSPSPPEQPPPNPPPLPPEQPQPNQLSPRPGQPPLNPPPPQEPPPSARQIKLWEHIPNKDPAPYAIQHSFWLNPDGAKSKSIPCSLHLHCHDSYSVIIIQPWTPQSSGVGAFSI